MTGIVSYGTYVPKYRVRTADIAAAWNKSPEEIIRALGVREKSVPGVDEDAVTMATDAAAESLSLFNGNLSDVGALFVGSESHPYAVNPTSTIVGEMLGIGNKYLAADLEFACKAGTAGMQIAASLVTSGQVKYAMAVGVDTAQSKPHDALEYTSAAAAASFVIGKRKVIAELFSYTSFSSDTPDFWRRDGIKYPSHAGRFTGEPAYFAHVLGAAQQLLTKSKTDISDVDYCVFHMPNGKFPRDVAKRLGFSDSQLAPSLVVDAIGNPYSASSMMGFASVLDDAKPDKTIFMVSYGSGAGSDAFLWKTTQEITLFHEKQKKMPATVAHHLKKPKYMSYTEYLRHTHKI